MILIQTLLNRAFPLMAITGLLLAGWGMIVTPDEIKGNAQLALWGGPTSSAPLETSGITSWQ